MITIIYTELDDMSYMIDMPKESYVSGLEHRADHRTNMGNERNRQDPET